MKKLISLTIALLMLLSLCSAAFAEGEEPEAAPSIRKPVHITIVDELAYPAQIWRPATPSSRSWNRGPPTAAPAPSSCRKVPTH